MRGRFVLTALLGLAAVLLAGLGIWQIERRAEKLALIARTEAKLAAPPVALPPPGAWARIDAADAYTRIRANGHWLTTPPAFVKAVTDAGPGWWVVSPFRTASGIVLVNRGFVPEDERGRVVAPRGGIVSGLLRLPEPGGAFLRNNDPAHDRWYSRDVRAIADARGLGRVAPFFVDADAVAETRWPRGGMTVVRFPNNHLSYALTWFALAGLAGWFAWAAARR
jgi:surfeit locus 1 family protein